MERRSAGFHTCLFAAAVLLIGVQYVIAQQVPGTPGSSDATTTIDGKQFPPPSQKFEGKIGRNVAESKPYWLARVVPPKGAPNVLSS